MITNTWILRHLHELRELRKELDRHLFWGGQKWDMTGKELLFDISEKKKILRKAGAGDYI